MGNSKKVKKIGFFIDSVNHLSGVTVTITDWVNWLNKQDGIEAEIIYCDKKEYRGCHGVNLRSLYRIDSIFRSGVYVDFPDLVDIGKKLRGKEYDIIHISTPGAMGLLGLGWGKCMGVPVVGTYHTNFPEYMEYMGMSGKRFTKDYLMWFYGNMELVGVPSKYTENALRGWGFNNTRVISRGLDLGLFNGKKTLDMCKKYGIRDGTKKILYVGRIVKEKGLGDIVDGLKELIKRREDLSFIFVGDGEYRNELEKGLGGGYFLGVKKEEELAKIYASCDCFIFPSRTDTFGRVVLEALACGLPVIASDSGGHVDMIKDCENGYKGKIEDIKWFEQSIDDVINSRGIRERAVGSVSEFDIDCINGKMLTFLEEGIWIRKE